MFARQVRHHPDGQRAPVDPSGHLPLQPALLPHTITLAAVGNVAAHPLATVIHLLLLEQHQKYIMYISQFEF